jgi:two-component system NtrC family sensor kinase
MTKRIDQGQQADLVEQEERYRGLLETAFEGIAIYHDGEIIDANTGLARMFGYTLPELIGMPVMAFIAEEAQDQILRDVEANGERSYETLAIRQDGTTFHIELVLRQITYRGRQVRGVAVRDITERKQMEEALRESEEQHRTLIETSPDGIMLLDLDTAILMVNPALLKLHGCDSADELAGQKAIDLIAPEEIPRALASLSTFVSERVLRGEEYNLLRKDGTIYPAEVSATLIVDAHQDPKAILAVVRDMSERRRMEKTVQRRNRELELLNDAGQALNASLDLEQVLDTTLDRVCVLLDVEACSVWLIEPETGVLVCRSATGPHGPVVLGWRLRPGEGLAGWVAQTGESLVVDDAQTDERHFRDVEQQTGTLLRSIISIPMRIKEDLVGVLQVLHADANRFQPSDLVLVESLATSAAIALENARLYKNLRLRMEELKNTQAQLIQSAKMAAIGELAAGVAHELNTPLTSVMGYSELLLEHVVPDDPDRKKLEIIVRQSCQARDIVRSLLSFSRQDAFHREMVNLNQVIEETMMLLRSRMQSHGVNLVEQLAPDLPPLLMDMSRMKQVFLNLITNALQAMPGEGTLTIRTERNENKVVAHIRDTGEGISEENLPRIFEPFFTTKPVGQGAGLGLAVSLGIVQEHGGQVQVDSHVGEGSTFTVWLPLETEAIKTA